MRACALFSLLFTFFKLIRKNNRPLPQRLVCQLLARYARKTAKRRAS